MSIRMKKRISFMLAVLMVLFLLPTQSALAAEAGSTENSLVAHYDMSKAGGKLTDVTGSGFDAEYVGFQDGDFVNDQGTAALNFTGDKSKYVKLPKGLITSESFTIETKFSTNTKAAQWLYTLGTKTGTWPNVNNYVFLNPMQDNGSVRFGMKNATTELLFQNATIKSGEYNTFTAAFEPGKITLYLNGEMVGNIAHTYSVMDILTAGVDPASDYIGFIGKSLYTPDAAFAGKLADFKVYNYTLSAEEIKQNNTPEDTLLVEQAKQRLEIPNAGDIRGNITLPSVGYKGAAITWATDRPDVVNVNEIANDNYDSVPPGVVTRQDADTQVKLTATLTSGSASATKEITLTVKAKAEKPDFKKYIFTHFTGESATGEQIYFASSEDGLHWTDLNDGNPVLTSDLGEKGVRDPFILRSAEGDKFYILATDLRIASGKGWGEAQHNGSKSLIIWESNDLVNWSQPRMVEVAVPNAGYAWAPEATYDEKTGEYVVYWASSVQEDGVWQPPNIYYAKTRDFFTFTDTKMYIDRPGSQGIIDTTMIKAGGKYYRMSGDGQITIEQSDEVLGTWSKIGDLQPIGLTGSDVEGPLVYKFNDRNEWNLMVDQYATGKGYLPLITSDLSSGNFRKLTTGEYSLGGNLKRHGTILNITQEEYDAVMAKWHRKVQGPDEEESQNPILAYNFDETSTDGTIQDASGNGHAGALNGNAAYVTDTEKNSKVLYLDGTSGTFAAFPEGFFEGRNTVTISMDVKAETVSGNFFTFTIGKNDQKYMFLRTRDTEIRNAITTGSWSAEQEAKGSTASIKSKWMNLKLVITPTSMAIYKDGVLFAQNNNVTLTMSDLGTNLLAYLGKSFYSGDAYFKGYFDNVKVYNRALTPSEISGDTASIDKVELSELKTDALIDSANHTITMVVKAGSNIKSLAPTFTLSSGASISPASGSAQDFTNPVTYTVTGQDNKVQAWTVTAHLLNTPILPGLYADPNVAVFGNKFYIYPTTDGFAGWSGTQFKVFSSDDLVHWTDHGVIFDVPNDTTWATGRAWAPTIEEKNGKYYFYFCADAQIGVAVSDSPTGPFVDALGKPLIATGQYGSGQMIDPAVFTDDDGQSYLYFGNGHAYVGKLSEDMLSLSDVKDITPSGYNEGSFVIKRDGKYYFMWSENDTRDENYRVAYAIGDSPMGPFTKQSIVLQKDLTLGIKGTGHHSVVKVPGKDEYYMVYHRFAIPGGDGTHRETTIDKLEFNADGTIKPVTVTLEGIAPVSIPGVPTSPKASLQGPSSVLNGQSFDVTYGLNSVTANVYAQDVTISYDPQQVEFVSAKSLNEDWQILAASTGISGKVRLIAAKIGSQHENADDLFQLSWKAKSASSASTSTLTLTNVTVAGADGVEANVEGGSYSVQIEVIERNPGDMNNDQRFSIGDLALVATYYGKDSSDPNWTAMYKKADMNNDGLIDIADISAVARLILQD